MKNSTFLLRKWGHGVCSVDHRQHTAPCPYPSPLTQDNISGDIRQQQQVCPAFFNCSLPEKGEEKANNSIFYLEIGDATFIV